MTEDKIQAKFWLQVKPGDIVLLSDKQALEDSMKAGLGVKPLKYSVDSIVSITDFDGLATWRLFHMKSADVSQELLMTVKVVDRLFDVLLYYQTDFQPGSREDIVRRGDLFLFQKPTDPTNYAPKDLLFTDSLEKDGCRWVVKLGSFHGEAKFTPDKTGVGDLFATMTEYSLTSGVTDDKELLIVELGKDNGLITLYAGCTVNLNEVDIFPI